jgi:signal transduction histidine kinase
MKLNIQTRDGGIFNAYVFMSRLKTEIKQKVQYIFNIVDLSKDEKLKTQLEKIEQLGAIARLSDAIMHDVRNPINSLALNIDVLTQLHTKRSFHSEEMSDILVKINRQISTLAQNLNRYVGYSKITELKLEPIDVGETLNELILDTHLLLTEKRISLNFRQPKSQLLINGDWNQIIRVFRNLIDNAIDAIGTKGSIDVTVRKRNNNIIISIVDSGSGINPENLLNVFKPYFTTKDKGSGLGLFIVREIVRAHHGRIYCKSSVDQGTRFTVSIPTLSETT